MPVIVDEVLTEIEPAPGPTSSSTSSSSSAAGGAGAALSGEQDLVQRITRLQERQQRLMAD